MSLPSRSHQSPASSRSIDGLSLVLLAGMLITSSAALSAAAWADHLSVPITAAWFGVLAGTALARSRFPGWLAFLFASMYGAFLVGWTVGLTLDPALEWSDRALDLAGRVGALMQSARESRVHQDPLMFVMAMAGLYWVAAAWAGWTVFRKRQLWPAVLPAGIGLLVNAQLYGGPRRMGDYLALYVLLSILLALRTDLAARQAEWQGRRAQVPGEASASITRWGAAVGLVLVVLAWTGPAFAQSEAAAQLWSDVTRPWRDARDRLGEAFSGLRGEVIGGIAQYGQRLRLGTGSESSDDLVFVVRAATGAPRNGRFYWRLRTYDTYRNGVWSSRLGIPIRFDPDIGNLPVREYASRETITFTFTTDLGAMETLYLPSQPLWVSRTAEAVAQPAEEGLVDPLVFESRRPVVRGESYRARSSIATPLAGELRLAGANYPDWIREGYLDLPGDLPPRIRELATVIASDADNPFDQASAVTDWLRENIEYRRVLEGVPDGMDPVEWFLFEGRVGFCDYYASGAVILLRALGIPARVAVGYARGAFNLDEGVYEVRRLDAHAWPEVFFPNYGWVEFEPTASQAAIARPDAADPSEDEALAAQGGLEESQRAQERASSPSDGLVERPSGVIWSNFVFLLLVVAGLGAAGLGVMFRVRPASRRAVVQSAAAVLRLAGLEPPSAFNAWIEPPHSPLSRVYADWVGWLRRLGEEIRPEQTALERASLFRAAFPSGAQQADAVVEAYNRERFGEQPPRMYEVLAAWDDLERSLRQDWWRRLPGRVAKSLIQAVRRRWSPHASGV